MVFSDKPITDVEQDKLGRKGFVDMVSKAICQYNSKDNYAISIQGKWGCGKTSILNMIVNRVSQSDKPFIIVNFNPWNFNDCNQLISQFFKQLSTELLSHSQEKGVKKSKRYATAVKLAESIDKYSVALGCTEYVPIFGKYLKVINKVAYSFIGNFINSEKAKKANISLQKDSIVKALEKSDSRILVTIDDIDRLTCEQIRAIFLLVGSVANFPNITYILCYDKQVVVRALDDVQKCDGNAYLEKLIQVAFDIPMVKRSKLSDILLEKIKAMTDVPEEFLNTDYWQEIYTNCILPFIESARDINRYMNLLTFCYTPLKEDVNFADMAGIVSFKVFVPLVYDWIRDNKITLVTENKDLITISQIKENKVNMTKYFDEIYSGCGDKIINALSSMFPEFYRMALMRSMPVPQSELLRANRIASPQRFDAYFSLSPEDIGISHSLLFDSITNMSEVRLKSLIAYLKENDLYKEYKSELTICINEIPKERLELILSVLMFKDGRISENNSLIGYENDLDEYIVAKFLNAIENEEERYKLVKNIFEKSDFSSFENLLHLLIVMENAHGKNGLEEQINYTKYKIISPEHLTETEQNVLNRIIAFSKEKNILEWVQSARALFIWKSINRQSYNEHMKEILSDPINAIRFISLIVVEWFSTNGTVNYELDNRCYYDYEEIITDEELLNCVESERLKENFWNLDASVIDKAIAFTLLLNNKSLVERKDIIELYNQWKQDYKSAVSIP